MKRRILFVMSFVLCMASFAYGSGDLFVMGNLGLGTTTPTQKLHVEGGTGGTALLFKAAPNTDAAVFVDVETAGKVPNIRFQLSGITNWFISNNTSDNSLRMSSTAKLGNEFVIAHNGDVGIGVVPPGGYKLDVNGVTNSSGGYTQVSDMRFKKDIAPIDSALDKVMGIEGVSYNWKKEEFKDKGFPEGRHYGVTAQQIENILPEVVATSPSGEKAVSYTEIVPVLIEAIKEQQKEIKKLEAAMALLRTKI